MKRAMRLKILKGIWNVVKDCENALLEIIIDYERNEEIRGAIKEKEKEQR